MVGITSVAKYLASFSCPMMGLELGVAGLSSASLVWGGAQHPWKELAGMLAVQPLSSLKEVNG